MSPAGSTCSAVFSCFADHGMPAPPTIAAEIYPATYQSSSSPGFADEDDVTAAAAAFQALAAVADHDPSVYLNEYSKVAAAADASVSAAVSVSPSPAGSSPRLPMTTNRQYLPLHHAVDSALRMPLVPTAPVDIECITDRLEKKLSGSLSVKPAAAKSLSERKISRACRNRESANRSRQRKRLATAALENEVQALNTELKELSRCKDEGDQVACWLRQEVSRLQVMNESMEWALAKHGIVINNGRTPGVSPKSFLPATALPAYFAVAASALPTPFQEGKGQQQLYAPSSDTQREGRYDGYRTHCAPTIGSGCTEMESRNVGS
jgi:bZIP transcription factor